MFLYKTVEGPVFSDKDEWYVLQDIHFSDILFHEDHRGLLNILKRNGNAVLSDTIKERMNKIIQAPLNNDMEIWAAGVTYTRSREAREKESGGITFYDKVYEAKRPELFIKALPRFVVDPFRHVRIRKDSDWNVPEPELAVLFNQNGGITGYTIGNDMSSRSIEGENPLYLTQAKVYNGCTSVGPGILVGESLPQNAGIHLTIKRYSSVVYEGSTSISKLKRSISELGHFLFRECSFPNGVILLTGTGIVPDDDFTLHKDDVVEITIQGIGKLINPVSA